MEKICKIGALLHIIKKNQFQVNSSLICVKQALIKFRSKYSALKDKTNTKAWTIKEKVNTFDCIKVYNFLLIKEQIDKAHTGKCIYNI